MSKSLRALSVLLFLAASFAFASTDQAGNMNDGTSPIPTCPPWQACGPNGN